MRLCIRRAKYKSPKIRLVSSGCLTRAVDGVEECLKRCWLESEMEIGLHGRVQ